MEGITEPPSGGSLSIVSKRSPGPGANGRPRDDGSRVTVIVSIRTEGGEAVIGAAHTPYQNSEDSEPVGLDNPLPPVSSDPPSIEGAQTPKASEGPTDTPRRTSQQNRLRMRMAPGADSLLEICAS